MKTYKKGERVAGKFKGDNYLGVVMSATGEKDSATYCIETDDGEMLVIDVSSDEYSIRKSSKKKPTEAEAKKAESNSAVKVKDQTLVEILVEYQDKLAEIKELKEKASALKEESVLILVKAREEMEVQKIKNCKFEERDGSNRLCFRITKNSPSIDDTLMFESWCLGAGVNLDQFKMLSTGKLKAWYNARLKEKQGLPLGIKVYTEETLGFRKA